MKLPYLGVIEDKNFFNEDLKYLAGVPAKIKQHRMEQSKSTAKLYAVNHVLYTYLSPSIASDPVSVS